MKKPTESEIQSEFIRWTNLPETQRKYPGIDLIYAHQSGMWAKNIYVAYKNKREGMKRGIPDLYLPFPKKPFNGLYIEFKRDYKSRCTKEQIFWLQRLTKNGYKCAVVWSVQMAIDVIDDYYGG